jgi:hypothetical protein
LPVTPFGVLVVLMCVISYGQSTEPRFVWSGFTLFIGAAAKLPRVIYWPVVVLFRGRPRLPYRVVAAPRDRPCP